MAWHEDGGPVDIGHNMTIMPAFDDAGTVCGLYEGHLDGEGRSCSGFVSFDAGNTPCWTVEQLDPLTISPSVLCRRCGNHGVIRGGVWEPA